MTRLEHIKTLLEAVTSGPWHTGGISMPDSDNPTTTVWGPREKPEHQSGSRLCSKVPLADAEFIVAAPENVAWLLEQVEELANACQVWLSGCTPEGCDFKGCIAARAALAKLEG